MENALISVVSGSLPFGGSSTFVLNLAKGLGSGAGTLSVVCMEGECPLGAEFEKTPGKILCVDRKGHIIEDTILETYEFLAKIRPKAVLSNLSSESFELLRMVPEGVLRLGIIHSDDPGPYRMALRYAPWMDGIVGVSETICNKLKKMPEFGGVKVFHIPYGISFPPEDLPKMKVRGENLRVIYLGRLIEEQKRISRLVSLIQLASSRNAPIHFTVAGSGPQEAEFLREVQNLENVTFLGHLPNAEVSEALRKQDVYILLSDYEGLPLSLLEAMGEGVVPVVPDMESGIKEVVTAENGIRLKETSAECALQVLEELAASPDWLEQLSGQARVAVRENYTAAAMAGKFRKILEEAPGNQTWPLKKVERPLGLPETLLYHPALRFVRRFLKWLRTV